MNIYKSEAMYELACFLETHPDCKRFMRSYKRSLFHSVKARMQYQDWLAENPILQGDVMLKVQNSLAMNVVYKHLTAGRLAQLYCSHKQKYVNGISLGTGYVAVDMLRLRPLVYSLDAMQLYRRG